MSDFSAGKTSDKRKIGEEDEDERYESHDDRRGKRGLRK
jgi:hypothetical protein